MGHEFFGPTIAPQNPAARLLVGEEGFGDFGPTSWLVQVLHSTHTCVFTFTWETCQVKSHPFVREYSEVSTIEARLPEDLEILRLWMVWEIEPELPCLQRVLGICSN